MTENYNVLDHVGIAVHDLEAAIALYVDGLGGKLLGGGDSDRFSMRSAHIGFESGSKIELLTPISEDSPLRDFLTKKGEGVHHITFLCDTLDGAVSSAESAGFPCTALNREESNWHEAYVRPQHSMGTLIQFAETPSGLDQTAPEITRESLLAGAWHWQNAIPQLRTETVSVDS